MITPASDDHVYELTGVISWLLLSIHGPLGAPRTFAAGLRRMSCVKYVVTAQRESMPSCSAALQPEGKIGSPSVLLPRRKRSRRRERSRRPLGAPGCGGSLPVPWSTWRLPLYPLSHNPAVDGSCRQVPNFKLCSCAVDILKVPPSIFITMHGTTAQLPSSVTLLW